jgi:hypothetical protein
MQDKKEEGKKACLETLALPLQEKNSSSGAPAPTMVLLLSLWCSGDGDWR